MEPSALRPQEHGTGSPGRIRSLPFTGRMAVELRRSVRSRRGGQLRFPGAELHHLSESWLVQELESGVREPRLVRIDRHVACGHRVVLEQRFADVHGGDAVSRPISIVCFAPSRLTHSRSASPSASLTATGEGVVRAVGSCDCGPSRIRRSSTRRVCCRLLQDVRGMRSLSQMQTSGMCAGSGRCPGLENHSDLDTWLVRAVPPVRHLLRARDLADARYFEPLRVEDLARAAGVSRAHFSAEFRRAFGESPHEYLISRRLERAAAMLRCTDRSVAEICSSVGFSSVGSFTTSFTRAFGLPPTAYRRRFAPAAAHALVPTCFVRAYGRPQYRTFREDSAPAPP